MDGRGEPAAHHRLRAFEAEPTSSAPRLVELLKQSGMVGIGVSILPYLHEIPDGDDRGRGPRGSCRCCACRRRRRSARSPATSSTRCLSRHAPAAPERRAAEAAAGGAACRAGFRADSYAASGSCWAPRCSCSPRRGGWSQARPGRRSRGADAFARDAWNAYRAVAASGTPRSVLDVHGTARRVPRGARRRRRRAGPDGCLPRGQPDLRVRGRGPDVRPAPARARG